MEGLKSYCEQTSLHGWYYISSHGGKTAWRIVWTAIVVTSIAVASYFIYKAAEDFTTSTVVTTIHSTTEPLSEVYFPAVTVCNINQVWQMAKYLTYPFYRFFGCRMYFYILANKSLVYLYFMWLDDLFSIEERDDISLILLLLFHQERFLWH